VLGNLGDLGFNTSYGSAITDSQSLAHGTGLDTYFVTITVNASPTGDKTWGTFSGSFSANHTAAVPEGGYTGLMTGLAFLVLVSARKRYQTAQN
jgi:hypothetical protein